MLDGWIYILAPSSIILSFLITYFFSKEAGGGGNPQIIAAIEAPKESNELINRLLGIRMLITKIIGSITCGLGGASVGPEGPTLQISAGIFQQVTRFWPKALPPPQQNLMILAGSAGGLAAAFNTPLGGVVFAIEELSKNHISLIRTSVFQAVIMSGIVAQIFMGNYLYLGHPQLQLDSPWMFLQTLVLAFVIGFTAAFSAEAIYQILKWRAKQSFSRNLALTVFCALVFALLIKFCGVTTLGGGKMVMTDLLNNPDTHSTVLLPFGRVFGNFITFVGGVVGGIFAPALASGAAMAQYITSELGLHAPRVMVLVGMVAFLTGLTRSPFTSFVLVLEMSDSHEVILYLMLASFVASLASLIVSPKSFYAQAAHDILAKNAALEPPAPVTGEPDANTSH